LHKIQQFFIFKIQSSRLKESNFKIKNLTLDQARLNGEVVSLSNSQMIRTIQEVKNKSFSQYAIDKLLKEKNFLSKKKSNKDTKKRIKELHDEIDKMLFLPEIISVSFDDKRHFMNILDRNGFLVNGVTYVPFMASAGMIRRDTYLFIDNTIKEVIELKLNNGRDEEVEIVPAKFSAYYSLYSSSTIPVSFPKMAVVSDLIIKSIRTVDFSTYVGEGYDPIIEETELELECNAFDGEGVCSPSLAKKWATDLGITDYTPSLFGVRSPFLKGMMAVFDIHEFAEKVSKTNVFKDIYGNEVDIRNIECIVSESMFKLWSSYKSTEEYVSKCKENNLDWGITKVNPKNEKNHAKSSYQFIQVLDLNDEQIEKLCEPTLSWLDNVSGGSLESTLLYSLGETDFSRGWFNRLDYPTQALLLDNSLLTDSYLVSYLDKSITKKKHDARIGRLIFNGNYQVMIADPYAFMSHVFGLGVAPLLKDGEHYSKYWNDRNKSQVVSIRSPIVHSSEVNILNLRNDEDVNHWYKHINSGVIFPANGVGMDSAIQGGSDYDLDLTCTFDSQEFIDGKIKGLPILYDIKKPSKIKINKQTENYVVLSQVSQIKSNKIGFLTNVGSTFYSLLYNFRETSKEYKTIINRLKYFRVAQGLEIDKTKGVVVEPFPEHFVKWKKIREEMSDEEKERITYNNFLLADKRPYFMRWLYSHFNRIYLREILVYDGISQTKWGMSFEKLMELNNRTDEQNELIKRYKRKTFFVDNNSVMNRLSHYVERKTKEIRLNKLSLTRTFDYSALVSSNFKKPQKRDLDKMQLLFKEYKSLKRSLRDNYNEHGNNNFSTIEQIFSYINKKAYGTISSNSSELADIAIYLCYQVLGKNSKSFCWKIFGKEIVQNMREKKKEKFVRVPLPNPKGNIQYLWNQYGMYLLNIEE
jgi:hypothetical protein